MLKKKKSKMQKINQIEIKLDLDVNLALKVLEEFYSWLYENQYSADCAIVYQKYRNLLVEREKNK